MKKRLFWVFVVALTGSILAQTKDAYDTDDNKKGLLDPSHFSMHNSLSFGMISNSDVSGIKSQSLYTTMFQYKFTAPVTVNLNFGLPLYSTVSSAQNLNKTNIESMEYFKNMPISASFTWQPTEKLAFHLDFERNTYSNYFFANQFPSYFQEYPGWYRHFPSNLNRDEDKN